MPKGKGRPPKGTRWLDQLFDKIILLEPDGVVFRKVSSVERQASEIALLVRAKAMRFSVTRIGTHYAIHRPGVSPVLLLKP
jgi:hypothetical protein